MGDASLWARLRCKWSGHTDHVVYKSTGHIYCGRCQAMCPPGTALRGDVVIQLSAIDALSRRAPSDVPTTDPERPIGPDST